MCQMSPDRSYDEKEDESCTDEEKRLLRRREKNRLAAQKCRQKKRDASNNLVKEYQDLESSNTQLRYEIRKYEKEKKNLESILTNHLPECTKKKGSVSSASGGSTSDQQNPAGHISLGSQISDHALSATCSSTSFVSAGVFSKTESSCKTCGTDTLESCSTREKPKRGPYGPGSDMSGVNKRIKTPISTKTGMVIPTPIFSEPSRGKSLSQTKSSAMASAPISDLTRPLVDELYATTQRLPRQTGSNPSLGAGNSNWPVSKEPQTVQQGKSGPSFDLLQTQATYLGHSTQVVTSDTRVQKARFLGTLGQETFPSQISSTGINMSGHVTPQSTDINILANQGPLEVTSHVQRNPSTGMSLVVPPPHDSHVRFDHLSYSGNISELLPAGRSRQATSNIGFSSPVLTSSQPYSTTETQPKPATMSAPRDKSMEFPSGLN